MIRSSIGQPALTPRRTQTSGQPVLKRKADRRTWLLAWVLTLVLHGGAILGLQCLPPLEPTAARSQEAEPIRLVFSKPAPETRKNGTPHIFSELPPERADKAPEKADFLSNVTSRARDLVPGGDAALPRMQGESDAPMVKLEPSDAPSQPPAPVPPTPRANDPATPRPAESQQGSSPRVQETTQNAGDGAPSLNPRDPNSPQRARDAAPPGSAGNSDIYQPEMANPDGNAGLSGDVSLNTTAWDYAPWLQRFGRKLMRRWIAPPAYSMGLLKEGGWAVIELEISRSGNLLRFEILEEQGHPSLMIAAQDPVRYMAPYEPLPADFPEPTLILRLRMIYPKIRPR